MSANQFFKSKGPIPLDVILKHIKSNSEVDSNFDILGIQDLKNANTKDISFLHSIKYKEDLNNTKAFACVTSKDLAKYIPKRCKIVIVNNVLFAVTQISKLFYPNSDFDHLDASLKKSSDVKNKYPKVSFGINVLIGSGVKIGQDSFVASNSIIESNVVIGSNCVIGSFVVIRNAIIEDEVHIQDGSVVGKKGFGFIPLQNSNLRTPQVGKIILKKGVELGSNCTLDRGSLNDTVIGCNTFLDNQVHIAHNVKIGDNCIVAGQVGIAGSSTIGDNVMIGGQAGISGHLKIGNNVKIGGGSGVVNDLPDNSKVMGYPAIPLKEFAKLRVK